MSRIALVALALAASTAAWADAVTAGQAAADVANTSFLIERCGGSPWPQTLRDAAVGEMLRGGMTAIAKVRRAQVEAQAKADGVERVCAALRNAYSNGRTP